MSEPMELTFDSVRELQPGPRWLELVQRTWPSYERWFLRDGEGARPGFVSCRAQLRKHMPELVPLWERLVALAGGGDHLARMLSLYRPTPYLTGCSQATWTRDDPFLIRNYDYHPSYIEGRVLLSQWLGTKVIAQSDCLWGVLDGMNEHGLAVSLSFGGRVVVGEGFGIPLILRYVLETCSSAQQATEVLQRIPSHMAYNVTVIDRAAVVRTLHLSPDRPVVVHTHGVATNHQAGIEWTRHAELTRSVEREALLLERVADASERPARLIERFMEAPLYSTGWERAHGTLYGAVYRPRSGEVAYLWPTARWMLSFDRFDEMQLRVRFGTGGQPASVA